MPNNRSADSDENLLDLEDILAGKGMPSTEGDSAVITTDEEKDTRPEGLNISVNEVAAPSKFGSTLNSANNDEIAPAYATLTPHLIKQPKSLVANRGQAILWYLLSLAVVGIDQWTKWLAQTQLTLHEPIPVIEPVLNWTLAYNYGAAWSFLADQGGWQKWFFAGIAMVMSVILTLYLARSPRQAKWLNLGLALVLGGAIGNLIDRVRLGKVVDFIHVHYMEIWHYPIFNIADMAICIGVVFVFIDIIFLEPKRNID